MNTPRAIRSWTSARGQTATHLLVLVAGALALASTASAETWRGLVVAPEHRCSAYERQRDYPYPQSVEADIIHNLGNVYGPYSGTCFSSARDTDVEHIVAVSEAQDYASYCTSLLRLGGWLGNRLSSREPSAPLFCRRRVGNLEQVLRSVVVDMSAQKPVLAPFVDCIDRYREAVSSLVDCQQPAIT